MARISQSVQEIRGLLEPNIVASEIAVLFDKWKNARAGWEAEQKELRNYLFATDTTTTSNNVLPWKNSTTTPKLTQIRDNLHANYMAALFPHDDWFTWRAEDNDSASKEIAKPIIAYMKTKIRSSSFKKTVSTLLYDYIDSGNAFGEAIYAKETAVNEQGEIIPKYIGPKLLRLSPNDIMFDISADSFQHSPKVTRSFMTLGQLKKAMAENPDMDWADGLFDEIVNRRQSIGQYKPTDIDKAVGYKFDGFGSVSDYFSSGLIEVLEFEGDLFIQQDGTLLENYQIIVVDRIMLAAMRPTRSLYGSSNKEHVAWRLRTDNLMGMGPLNNLVGLQYRVDHLENLRADVFDQIAHPPVFQAGIVDDWEWGPGERIFGDPDSSVQVLRPDTTALAADLQIDRLLNLMEEMAGAPKQAMGIRTPGEKTAFEVQQLQTAAGRIFQNKIEYFEENFIEPLLNQMFEQAKRNLDAAEAAEVIDDEFGATEFIQIRPNDLKKRGKLVPVGARHFARKAQIAQNLLGLANSAIYQDSGVNVHISGLKIAEMIEELLDLGKYDMVKANIRVAENLETQQLAQTAQSQNFEQLATAATEVPPPSEDEIDESI